jgi:hypothetical protein
MAPAMRRAGCGSRQRLRCGQCRSHRQFHCGSSSGSSSSRISAQMRVRSARAAVTLRWQNAMRIPGSTCSAMATPRRAGSSPTMWRTTVSAPKCPVRPTALTARPQRSARPALRAPQHGLLRALQRDLARSRSNTSSAGSPSSPRTTAVGRRDLAHRRHRAGNLA